MKEMSAAEIKAEKIRKKRYAEIEYLEIRIEQNKLYARGKKPPEKKQGTLKDFIYWAETGEKTVDLIEEDILYGREDQEANVRFGCRKDYEKIWMKHILNRKKYDIEVNKLYPGINTGVE